MSDTLFTLRGTIRRGPRPVLTGIDWTVRAGQTWAITGPVGCGKTTLVEAALGRLPIAGELDWPILPQWNATRPGEVARFVAFREDSRLFRYVGHYYQQRYDFADADEPLSLRDYLTRGVTGDVVAVAGRMGVDHVLDSPFIALSNGQTRRARLARALLAKPRVLALDDPFVGLDAGGRADVSEALHGLVRDGLHVLLVVRADQVPGWVTDGYRFDSDERRGLSPPKDFFFSTLRRGQAPPLVELARVTVAYAGTRVLDEVSWTVRPGERWAVLGPNGSGKTTLLSLLCGDHPQAYANDIRLFGRRRGSGESIWDVKRRIGFSSPELHLYFTAPLTAGEVGTSGFHDVVTDHPASPDQRRTVADLFDTFGIRPLLDRPFQQLSTGEQRLVLFVRAIAKRPALLILDEPFQGFDPATIQRCRDWLARELTAEQGLIFVTHDPAELPAGVDRWLRLDRGRVV